MNMSAEGHPRVTGEFGNSRSRTEKVIFDRIDFERPSSQEMSPNKEANKMKHIIAIAIALFTFSSLAEAGQPSRRIAYTKSCGHHVYQVPVLAGYDSCRRPVYRYVTQSSCGCSKSSHRAPSYNRGHSGHSRSVGYAQPHYTQPRYTQPSYSHSRTPVYRGSSCGHTSSPRYSSGVSFRIGF